MSFTDKEIIMPSCNEPHNKGNAIQTNMLECRTNRHNKFYEITLWEAPTPYDAQSRNLVYHVSTRHGKIGVQGKTTWYSVNNYYKGSAVYVIGNIMRSKLAKGYIEIPNTKTSTNLPKIETTHTRFSRILGS